MVVKVASWNVKGICNTLRQGEVNALIKDNNISFFGIIETQLRKKFVNKVCNEVFGVWEWVINFVDSAKGCRIVVGWDPLVISAKLLSQDNQAMHFLVNSFRDNRQMFVSVVYGKIIPKIRTRLWRNLIKHKGVAGSDPWVVLGDFNVVLSLEMEDINMTGLFYTWIQKMRNPELGVFKKLDRVLSNAYFINKYPNSFAAFLPYLSSDHSPAILTIPDLAIRKSRSFRFANFLADKDDFIGIVRDNWDIDVRGYDMFKLAKKLRSMKRHMRQMNRKIGNVYEKVKVLKEELSRVQQSLDKDPLNALLREEEMGRSSRNRIEMVIDDLGNAHYEDSVTNIFMSHFEKFLGMQDTIYDVDDAGSLFIKRLDNDKAMELIKDVSNKEIKEAIFSIEDNKASGPDGYSLKFFKATWSVVGKDICAAIKEFFNSVKLLGELNTTLISLVHKTKSPARVIDYRPISCCNIVYKGYNWEYVTRCCAFKIDIMKAYDTVSWTFLEFCLNEFGFHLVMVHWIRVCLRTASFSVCVNGDSHGFFNAKRGLRQGDPISPYLFTLVIEVLNLMVKRQIIRDNRFKYHTGCSKLKFTSLCFADDLLMLCHGDLISASILRRVLDEFSLSSGLYPSMSKSEVFFSNVSPDVKAQILMAMPFKEGTFPIRYLGIPLASRRIKANDCKVLIDAVYWCSLFILPKLICATIDKMIKKFLWTSGDNACGMDSIWVKWINVHKLKGRCFWDSKVIRGHSWVWAQLLDLREKIKDYVNVKISNGANCNVWFDKWNPNGPLNKLIDHRTLTKFGFSFKDKVCDLIQNGLWVWPDEWKGRFGTVLGVHVPVLNHNIDDKVYYISGTPNAFLDMLSFHGLLSKTVRLRLRGLTLKKTVDVISASAIWGLPIDRSKYDMDMIHDLCFPQMANNDLHYVSSFHFLLWFPMMRCYGLLIVFYRDPESKNPSSYIPDKVSDEFIKPKKITRSSIRKPQLSTRMKHSRRVSFKAGKGSVSAKGMKGLVFGDDESEGGEIRDDGFDGDLDLNAFFDCQSVDSRRCGDSVSEKDARADLVKNMVSDLGNESSKVDNVSKVNDYGLGFKDKLGPMPVPLDKNPLLTVNTCVAEKWPKVGSTSAMNDETIGENGDGRKTSSFINAVQGMSKSGNNKLKLIPGRINDLGKEVIDMDPFIEEVLIDEGMQFVFENGPWLVDGKPLFVQRWEAGLCMVKPEPSKVPLWFKIMNVPLEAWNVEGISRIASRIGNPIIMDRITTSMCEKAYGRASFARVLVEVEAAKGLVDSVEVCYKTLGRSMELRVEYPWKPPVCSHCKVFGHCYDKCTSRVLTDAEKAQKVEVKSQRVEGGMGTSDGEWKTVNYRRYGRNDNGSGGFSRQRYNNGEGSSRGGFSGRGRGGLGGRGFGDQRFYRSENVQFVPVNEKNEVVNDSGVRRGINKKDGTSSENRFAMLSEEIEIEENLEWDYLKAKIDEACEKGIYISMQEKKEWPGEVMNYYKLKLQELVKKSDVDDLKLKIENLERQIAHSHNVVTSESRVKAKSMVKSVMIEQGLTKNQAFGRVYDQVFRDELERIKYMIISKLFAEAELFFKIGHVFTKHELDTWPEEKIDFYKLSIGDFAYEKIIQQIRVGNNVDMDEEVAEDSGAGHDCSIPYCLMTVKVAAWNVKGICNTLRQGEEKTFIKDNSISFFGVIKTQLRKKFVNKVCNKVFGVWEWVLNSVDSVKGCRIAVGWDPLVIYAKLLSQNDQAICFLVNSFRDNKNIFVLIVYGEITPKARTRIWKDLVEHKGLVSNNPWVVLRDFNVVLRFNENSNGLNIQGAGIKDFRDCIDSLELEDINMTWLFYTWIQKMRNLKLASLKEIG
ncbi:RNA-directed DNA polymerase, eukaryota, reverse transcriptase zinc-binding domain protein [Tanacetum coccineum]